MLLSTVCALPLSRSRRAAALLLAISTWPLRATAQDAGAEAPDAGPAQEQAPPPAAPGDEDDENGAANDLSRDEGAASEPPKPRLTPPTLLEAAAASVPAQAVAAGVSATTVLLRVTVDEHGQVTDAEVVEPQGHGLDEAAREAALRYRFEPARRDGEPSAARVLLRVELTAPTPPPPASAEPPSPTPPVASATPAQAPVEVTVQGASAAERLRRSAEAVQVVETKEAKQQTADLGEVLARTQGVGVQRAAGLGSTSRFSLNGLTDDQIRFYLDGVPLELSGYPFGLANVPVNLVERAEIYRGVVPIRFGADALGGAVNLVSDEHVEGTHASTSYQAGSFGTHRVALTARHLHAPSGWLNRASGFLDRADNDYPMDDIPVPDDRGREVRARVYRFHDGYRAQGGSVETGFVDRSWADRLLLRGFLTDYRKEVQHNLVMTYPYGDVELAELSAGGTLRYEQQLFTGASLAAVAGYAYSVLDYKDVGECVYSWFGQCVRERAQPGERLGRAQDQTYWDHSGYGRVNIDLKLHPQHALRVSLSPTYTTRSAEERRLPNPDARDPLSAQRELLTFVSGAEYQVELFADRLQNVLFVKDYLQVLRSEDPLAGGGGFRRRDRQTHRAGLGNSLRVALAQDIYAKASYEWATRLPRPDEVFGDAFPVGPNLELEPELSHNINLGLTVERWATRGGQLRTDLNGFARSAEQLILLIGDDQGAMYQNVYSARSIGVEAAAGWSSPGDYVVLDGNTTYVDFRNIASKGAFADSEGKPIPNRPYLFATGSARLQVRRLAAPSDELALDWTSRYVHEFLRGWAGVGDSEKKLKVDAQLLHSLALTYSVESDDAALSFTGELSNLTDSPASDFFGVPRPGRAFYFKATASL